MGATTGASTAMISSLTMPSISSLVVVLVLCNISISSESLNGSICSIILCNVSNGAICSKLCFLKSVATDLNHSSDGVDYYSSIAKVIDDISRPIATIHQ
jgi:hypothetical protein